MIIPGIWNDALVFLVGSGTAGYDSIIIGCWGVCVGVGVGVGVWSASTVCSSSATVGEVSACMGCRRGECRLGNRIYVCLIFIFLSG